MKLHSSLKHYATLLCFVGITMPTLLKAEPAARTSGERVKGVERTVAPLSQRFASDVTSDVPDFQKHVVPLLGRLGCNGRACHGSFQGRGGFQLSLFGYDFAADHEALLDENTGRVDAEDVHESLILAKPVDADLHEGGKRFEKDSWQYRTIQKWISAGADFQKDNLQKLQRLDVTPSEILFSSGDDSVQLKVIARWEDGTAEDVTELCRYSSNDDAIAEISELGEINSGSHGDTHVVVSYDNAVVPIAVLRPYPNASASYNSRQSGPRKPIDRLVQQKLDKLGIVASGLCTDEEFIRRVSLDMTGVLPAGKTVREFIADTSTNKRMELVEDLLDSPSYSAWWATRLSDWTGNSEEQLNNVLPVRGAATRLWYEWLRVRLDKNTPYDELIAGIVEAKSRKEDEGYTEFCESMTRACSKGNEDEFAERDGLPLFWGRRNFRTPEERAIGFAYTFLGVRIECAQCHKHPFDQWSKNDFEQFSKLFEPVRYAQSQVSPDAKAEQKALTDKVTGGKKLRGGDLRRAIYKAAQKGEAVPFGELLVNVRKASPSAIKKEKLLAKKKNRKPREIPVPTGKILGVDEPVGLDADPRPALMSWLRSEDNPYFAKAIVNRVWSNYFGIGIVNPTDDMNLANPPSNAALLDHLASEFIAHNFDLKWLHREIVASDTYQRSAETNETNKLDQLNFSRHFPRRLPAEVVYDAVVLATGSDEKASRLRDELDEMAIAEGKPRGRNQADFALGVFGQSIRETNCDCDRSDSPSLLQSIYLRNDADMHKRLADKDGWVSQVCRELGVPGPSSNSNPKRMAAERSALGIQKQIVRRFLQFKRLPANQKERTRPKLEREFHRVAGKLEQLGYNAPKFGELIEDPGSWNELQEIGFEDRKFAGSRPVDSFVEDAYLRTLSRYPDDEERQIATTFIAESETVANGVESLLWALVNTKEFIITH